MIDPIRDDMITPLLPTATNLLSTEEYVTWLRSFVTAVVGLPLTSTNLFWFINHWVPIPIGSLVNGVPLDKKIVFDGYWLSETITVAPVPTATNLLSPYATE